MDLDLDLVITHWPFVAFSLLCMIVIQFFKMAVWTQKRADSDKKSAGFFWWGRKTLTIQAIVFGALIGIIPGMPISGGFADSMGARALYYGFASCIGIVLFDILKGLAKKRGIVLQLPGMDQALPEYTAEATPDTAIETPSGRDSMPGTDTIVDGDEDTVSAADMAATSDAVEKP